MNCRTQKRLISILAATSLVATAVAHAKDAAEPKRVEMTEHALTTKQAQEAQKAWADHIGMDAVIKNSIGMQLCLIPPGKFLMGSPKGEVDRKSGEKQKVVTHSEPYFLGRYEVTQGEWERVMGPIPSNRPRSAGAGDRYPVYRIDHTEAAEFCRQLTRLDHEAGAIPKGYRYRLPTDAEWEYACRAGTLTATYFGDNVTSKQANFDGSQPYNGAEKGPNLGRTAEVGSYPANAWGFHDMHGNLCEWCLDWYHESPKGGEDPVHLTPAPKRLIRDARHGNPGRYCRSANRYYASAKDRRPTIGFRVVLSKLQFEESAAD